MFVSAVFLILLIVRGYQAQRQYIPPAPLIEPLSPIGIRISIPDEPGISLVSYHLKMNEKMVGFETGTITRDVLEAINGSWTFKDNTVQLYKGDVIYYWIRVMYRGTGYSLLGLQYIVTDFYDCNGHKIQNGGNDDGGSEDREGSFNNNVWNENNDSAVNNNVYARNGGDGNEDLDNDQESTCESSVTKQTDRAGHTWNPCAGQVLFYDDFQNWTTFLQKQWAHVERFPELPDYEFNIYRYAYGNIDINNGLKIKPDLLRKEYLDGDDFIKYGQLTLKQCTGRVGTADCTQQARGYMILPPVTSSRINTRNAVNFEYGRVEIRAKLSRGDWIYPLLMLEPLQKDDRSLASLRIRIASANGNPELSSFDGRDISGKLLWGGVTGLDSANETDVRDNEYMATLHNKKSWADEYHNYEMVWSQDKIVLKVDGRTYFDKQVFLPKNVPFYLTLGVAVGGLNEFPDWSISQEYSKPWRNVQAKAFYHFFNATETWYRTWQPGATSLDVAYVRITAL